MQHTFKAAILNKLNSPLVIDYIKFNNNLSKGQVFIKLDYAGVCGSQLGEIQGVKGKDHYLPHLLGHEGVGEVIKINKYVSKVKKGDKVLLHWMPSKGINANGPVYDWKNKKVNAGGLTTFNSFAVVSENKLTKLNSIKHDYRNTLLLGCTASTAIGSVEKLSNLKKTDIIAVSGCGSIGLSIIKYAKIIGVKKIIAIDINKNKLNFSKKFGANYILNLKKNNLSNFFNKKFPNGVNHFFECTGKINVISDAFECLNKSNGKEILIGVPKFKQKAKFYTLDLHLGKQLIGCKGGNFLPDKDLNRYLSIVNNKKFLANKMITNEIVLEDLNDVFSDMRKNSLKGKCIINFKKDC